MTKGLIPGLILGSLMALTAPVSTVQAALVQFQFTGTQTGGGATVQALLGIDSSLVVPNGAFTQADLGSFFVQYNGAFTASSNLIPATLSGQFNGTANVFSSLFSNESLTIPAYGGTNNFQFFGTNGQSWSFAGSGSVIPPAAGFNFTGTGTWTVAPVPVPAAVWLFGSGLAAMAGLARRRRICSSM